MASIFTFEPDPPRVSSPWGTPRTSESATPITRLEAEPQEGPTEYKLHLLLRTRRKYRYTSTGSEFPGSYRSVYASAKQNSSPKKKAAPYEQPVVTPALQIKTAHYRQQRLEQLTTQLLWRLQQSSPNHSTSATNQIMPAFPSANSIEVPIEVGRPIPGLEDSLGALYEIGVADDGSFVGLTHDEVEESIRNLRAMAASLGCVVEILRMVPVGNCEWLETSDASPLANLREGPLYVVEAYVKPNTLNPAPQKSILPMQSRSGFVTSPGPIQLRITLTGATMSGKSSLLGSLTTGTRDNGRGKGRLSLLRHRHEIASGMTSSVTQELLGYTSEDGGTVELINYNSDNVASWADIHELCSAGRLVLLSDSAGHPRFRRTTLRGLIGWSPDWTILCIPADNTEDTTGLVGSTPSAEEMLGNSAVDVDLSQTHLELCLKLQLKLVIVVTKYDLASKGGLRQTLSKVLSILKAAGRPFQILRNPSGGGENADLTKIPAESYQNCGEMVADLRQSNAVPIVLTSAVSGHGIPDLHALLSQLPFRDLTSEPRVPAREDTTLFSVEDTYNTSSNASVQNSMPILSGLLHSGRLSIGNELRLGPYAVEVSADSQEFAVDSSPQPKIPTSRSFPGALTNAKHLPITAQPVTEEWLTVRVVSLRYLRLPVTSIVAGQVATVGIQLAGSSVLQTIPARIRRGMVLASAGTQAMRSFTAVFARSDVDNFSIGMSVVVYVSSVRASAKVISGAIPDEEPMVDSSESLAFDGDRSEDALAFAFEEDARPRHDMECLVHIPRLHVTFQFLATREHVEIGSQVLIMPGGGPGLYGGLERGQKGVSSLYGYVGRIISSV